MEMSYLKSFPLLLLLPLLDCPVPPKPKSLKKSSKISEKDDEKSKLPKPLCPPRLLERQHDQIDHNLLFSYHLKEHDKLPSSLNFSSEALSPLFYLDDI